MVFYKYYALSNDGRKLSGTEYFENEFELLSSIRKKGYYVKKSKIIHKINYNKLFNKANIKDLAVFAKQLSSMLNAGFNISEALAIIHEQISSKILRKSIIDIEADVQKGSSFHESISKCKGIFPVFFIQMINAGEQSGNLDIVLESMSEYYMREYKIKRKIKSAMIYPIILAVTTIFIVFYLEMNIIPLFSDTFASLGTELPVYSKCFMDMSISIRSNFYLMLIAISVITASAAVAFKTDIFRYSLDKLYVTAPLIGTFYKKVIGAKFSNCMSLLQKSGMNIIYSLHIGSKVINNSYVQREMDKVLNNIKNGDSIAETLSILGIFPSFMISIIALGEKGGNLDEMLCAASNMFDEDIEDTLNKAVSILEPAMIIILAFLVGSVIMAVMVPMIKMMQAV